MPAERELRGGQNMAGGPQLRLGHPLPRYGYLVGTGLLAILSVALGLTPSLINGFPVVYSDSNIYLGFPETIRAAFPPFYSFFVWLIASLFSLQFVVLAQSAVTAFLVGISFRIGASVSWLTALAATAAVLLVTQLPWLVSWITTEWVGGLGLISMIVACLPQAGRRTPVFFFAILVAALFATSNLLVMAPLGLFLVWLRSRLFRLPTPTWLILSLLAVLITSVTLPVGLNAIVNGKATLAMGSSARLFSKLVDKDVAGPQLLHACRNGDHAACRIGAEVSQMTQREEFLWGDGDRDALADRMDAWNDRSGDFGRLAMQSILAHPIKTLAGGLEDALQLAMKLTLAEGVELDAHSSEDKPVLRRIRKLYPDQTEQFLAAKQQRNDLKVYFPATAYAVITLISYGLFLSVLIFACWKRDPTALFLLIAAAAAMIVSILVQGGLSLPVPRYLVKTSWLATWAVIVAAFILFPRRDHRRRDVLRLNEAPPEHE
jgi:hypothetical protein